MAATRWFPFTHYELKHGTLPPETTLPTTCAALTTGPAPGNTRRPWLMLASWAGGSFLLRYETMNQTRLVLQQMLDFIGLTATPAQIAQAVDNASSTPCVAWKPSLAGRAAWPTRFIRRGQPAAGAMSCRTAERDILKTANERHAHPPGLRQRRSVVR